LGVDNSYAMGLIPAMSTLQEVEKVTVSAFARFVQIRSTVYASFTDPFFFSGRRRLPVVLVKLKMAETLKEAITYIEQGRTSILCTFGAEPHY
jgi:U3 small nucleolar ribonucleoprotein protein IMP3